MQDISKNVKQRILIVITVVIVLLGILGILYVFDDRVAGLFELPRIQAALDNTCGKGRIEADIEGFTRDLGSSWWGEGTCIITADGYWRCNCTPNDLPPHF